MDFFESDTNANLPQGQQSQSGSSDSQWAPGVSATGSSDGDSLDTPMTERLDEEGAECSQHASLGSASGEIGSADLLTRERWFKNILN